MASTTVNRHRMRCSQGAAGCGRRFTLRRHPDLYVRTVKCPHCGSLNVRSDEKNRRRELVRQATCYCAMYPFPHRTGSLRMCLEHPLSGTEPTDEEILQYQECIATRRSGVC